jgi:hypothetical protein
MVEVTMGLTSGIMAPLLAVLPRDPRKPEEITQVIPRPERITEFISGITTPVRMEQFFPRSTVPPELSAPSGAPGLASTMPAVMTHVDQPGKPFSNGAIDHVNLGRVVASALLAPCTLVRRPGAQVRGPRRDFPIGGLDPIAR